ncbi:hypothetical protein POTOM_038440 [Populus tomentosa]|uniref:Uncharacterized protein n=1 Tax=Populus tomentosa TaxID=118781 RepID=A0A8X8CL44_POPTO|nr:hypothetical protein POTOM_038440 [Populus tomentosa]
MFKSFEDLLITIAVISNSFGVDILNQFSEDRFLDSPGGYVKDSRAALEFHRALQLKQPFSVPLEFLTSAINFPDNADLQRLAISRRIKHYATDDTRILKTSYRCSTIGSQDFLKLAVEDFSEDFTSLQRESYLFSIISC